MADGLAWGSMACGALGWIIRDQRRERTMTTKYNPRELAGRARCAMPDSDTSPGAEHLLAVQDTVNEGNRDVDNVVANHENSSGGFSGDHEMWQAFVDLGAYSEYVEDFTVNGPADAAGYADEALSAITRRLAEALISEAEDNDDEDD